MSDAPTAPPPPTPPRRPWSRAAIPVIVAGLGGVLLVLFAWRLPPFDSTVQSTDNAYVRGYVTLIAPKLDGYVTQVAVKDFMPVTQGQVLVRIDDANYRQKLAQAEATLRAAQAALAANTQAQAANAAQIRLAQAQAASARAALAKAQVDTRRAEPLLAQGWLAPSQRDVLAVQSRQASAGVDQALANADIARQALETTRVNRGSQEAQVANARAAVELARIDVGNTVIRAPEDGQVGEVGVKLGQYVAAGAQLMGLVPRQTWVIANFKETQTAKIRVGQPVRVRVDALGGAVLRGHVERLGPATGSEFAVIKPDNATGNFTKVVQRLPARIALEPNQPNVARLRPGMSVVVSIDTAR
ncbi:MAG: secretion protein HlyD family protein [Caulobacter sp.]|nr:secretion protein HlyD family protein [Caulobacter sp.]